MGDRTLIVFDPTPRKTRKGAGAADRAPDLEGKRLAVIWNGKIGGDVLLDRFSELLTDRLGLAGVERVDDRADAGTNLNEVVINRLVSTCDAAIIGTAD